MVGNLFEVLASSVFLIVGIVILAIKPDAGKFQFPFSFEAHQLVMH